MTLVASPAKAITVTGCQGLIAGPERDTRADSRTLSLSGSFELALDRRYEHRAMVNVLVAIVAGGVLLLAPVFRGEAAIYVYVDESGTSHFTNTITPPHGQPPPAFSPPRVEPTIGGGLADFVNQIAGEYGVDPKLVHAIIRTESKFDALAVSRKGAQGLMQLMPATADRYTVANIFDPKANIRGGIRYLRDLQGMFPGQLSLVLAAYNAGEQAVRRYNGIPPYPETRQYVKRVLELYERHKAGTEETEPEALTVPSRPRVAAPAASDSNLYRRADAQATSVYTSPHVSSRPPKRPTR